eukprot:gene29389-38478_t
MSNFPKDCDGKFTRAWLDKEGFFDVSKEIFGGLMPCWVKKMNSFKLNFLRQKKVKNKQKAEIDRTSRNVRQKTSSLLRPSEFGRNAASSFPSSNGEKFMGVSFNSILATFDGRLAKTTSIGGTGSEPSRSNIEDCQKKRCVKCAANSPGRSLSYAASEGTIRDDQTMARLNCAEGNASRNSVPDAFFVDSASRVRGLCVAKTNVSASIEGGRQGFAEASNVE